MSDHDQPADQPGEPSFDDPAFDDLRARLADARVTGPVPPEVADRLDATLAALRDERRPQREPAAVVPLRRRAGRLLVAAAALVVVGSGGIAVARLAQDDGSADRSAAASTADEAGSPGSRPTASPAVPPARSGTSATTPATDGSLAQLAGGAVPVFTTARFAQEAARFAVPIHEPTHGSTHGFADDDASKATTPGPSPTSRAPADAPTEQAAPVCAGPAVAGAQIVPIELDGEPAVLVVHPVADGSQLVEAWSCDGDEVLASATVAR